MQNLPEEVQEQVLLSVREASDLQQVCSVSSSQRRICSGPSFWREKFAREGLTMLEEGTSLREWLAIYQKSLQAAEGTEQYLRNMESRGVNLSDLPDLSFLPGLEGFLQPYFEKVKSGENIERIVRAPDDEPFEYIEIHNDYFIFLAPILDGHLYEVVERRVFRDGTLTRDHSLVIHVSPLISEQTKSILYRLFYFGFL